MVRDNYGAEASNVLGWLSIACWIIVYSPQILENYQLKSGEGLSVLFVLTWLLGDLCNLTGAILAHLLPTVIILAVYYTLCDAILLLQIYYYRWRRHPRPSSHSAAPTSGSEESTPLLPSPTPPSPTQEKTNTSSRKALEYILLVSFVVGTGLVAWLTNRDHFRHNPPKPDPENDDVFEWKSQAFGWASAVLYLGSRIPQIMKNMETKCEGLSVALFLFAIGGNITYVLSICVVSMEWKHLATNASWLAGSGLTVFLDFYVLWQFIKFRTERLAIERERRASIDALRPNVN